MERAEVRIVGRVQGVFYRASAEKEARSLGLLGWVRNTDDLAVEAVVEGPREKVEAFLAWCRQGPPAARVDEVDVRWSTATGEFDAFKVRR